MNSRRYFFKQLASGLVAAAAPGLFLPKLVKPGWKASRPKPEVFEMWENGQWRGLSYRDIEDLADIRVYEIYSRKVQSLFIRKSLSDGEVWVRRKSI